MHKNIKKFLKKALSELIEESIIPVFSEKDTLKEDSMSCNGYFSDSEKKLVVATGGYSPESWIGYFVHEYCHFLQWKNKTKAYKRETIWYKGKKFYALDLFWNWCLKKKEIKDESLLNECFTRTRDVELECERMTIKLLKKYKIPINIDQYVKEANAYVLTYSYMRKYRRPWKQSFFRKQVYGRMSKKFDYNYDEPPDFFFELIEGK